MNIGSDREILKQCQGKWDRKSQPDEFEIEAADGSPFYLCKECEHDLSLKEGLCSDCYRRLYGD